MKILGNLGSILDGCTHRQDAYTCEAIHQQYKDDLEILAPHWMDAHMYRDGMTVLADKMHTNVRLYISSTQVCLHDLCVSLVLATPLPE